MLVGVGVAHSGVVNVVPVFNLRVVRLVIPTVLYWFNSADVASRSSPNLNSHSAASLDPAA